MFMMAEYAVERNATQAAIRAGYSEKTANTQGPRLLVNVRVKAAIAAKQAEQLARVDLREEDALRAIARHVQADGHADVRDLVDEQGNLKNLKDLSDHAAMNVAGFDVVKRNLTSGDGKVDTVIKVKMRDQSRYVELASRILKLDTNRLDVHMRHSYEELRQRLAAGRAHMAKHEVVEGEVVKKATAEIVTPEAAEPVTPLVTP